jgi:hypothetical protein
VSLIEFKGGTDTENPFRVFVCPDMVVNVSATQTPGLVNIGLENGVVQVVQGEIDAIVAVLTKDATAS